MRVLANEQISSNRRFSKQYSRENSKSKNKKLEENQSFHQLLENEQNRLEEQNK